VWKSRLASPAISSALSTHRRIIVDDIVDTRLGSQRGDRRGDCVIDVNDYQSYSGTEQ
jgi:hypothetical protein